MDSIDARTQNHAVVKNVTLKDSILCCYANIIDMTTSDLRDTRELRFVRWRFTRQSYNLTFQI